MMAEDYAPLERIVPPSLLELRQWVAWKYERRADAIKPTKVPYNPRTGNKASSTNPQTWADFRLACRRAQTPGHGGVGFVATKGDPFCGIDLDDCRDAKTGALEPWALAIIRQMDSYTEVSPSGRGVRIFIRGKLPPGRKRDGSIEMYDSERFFTVTGRHLPGTPRDVEDRQAQLEALHRATFPAKERPGRPRQGASEPTRLDDAAIVKKAQAAKNGAKFSALWNGDTSANGGDASRADMALCNMLGFYTQDEAQLDRLFRQSGLMRDKWDERRGESTYGARTITAALSTIADTYSPKVTPIRQPAAQPARNIPIPITDGTAALARVPHIGGSEPPSDDDSALLKGEADDNGNAQAMYHLFGKEYLYTPAYGWLRWTGTHWRETPEPIVAQSAIITLKRRRHAAVEADKEAIIKATKADKTRVVGCYTLFKSYVIEPNVAAFDADPDALNCQNGVLSLRTGTLTPHDPSQRFTYCLPVAYKPKADTALWAETVLAGLGNDREAADYFQLCVGYSLSGHSREEKMFYVYGPTRAGKGTVTETLLALMPHPLSTEVDFATFTAKRESDNQNFDLAELKPARLVVASESNREQSLNPAKIKQMTGGNLVRCAFKHKDMFTYRPQFKVWLVSNHKLNGDPDDDALWGRVQVFTFPVSRLGAEDVKRKDRLKSPEVLEGVLRWAVEGAMRWYQAGRLVPPEVVKNATAEHRAGVDYIAQWIGDCCTLEADRWAASAALMQSFQTWCEANGVKVRRTSGDLADSLVKRFGVQAKRQAGTGTRGYSGIGLGVTPA